MYLIMMGAVSGDGRRFRGMFYFRLQGLVELAFSLSLVGRRGMKPLLEAISSRFL